MGLQFAFSSLGRYGDFLFFSWHLNMILLVCSWEGEGEKEDEEGGKERRSCKSRCDDKQGTEFTALSFDGKGSV